MIPVIKLIPFTTMLRYLLLMLAVLCVSATSYAKQSTHHDAQWHGPVSYQVCFTPGDDCVKRLSHFIAQAKHSIYVQAYIFTSHDLANALIDAQHRGVKVKMILDDSDLDPNFHSSHRVLKWFKHEADIQIWVDHSDGLAHNKVMIIDHHIVETGSFNYTYSAQKYNQENMVFIKSRQLANRYLKNWHQLQKQAKRLKGTK